MEGVASPESCSPGPPPPVSLRARSARISAAAVRERLSGEGPGELSDLELLAVVLGHGATGERVWRAVRALAALADLHDLALLSCRELTASAGRLGAAQAATLVACFELGRRLYQPETGPRTLTQAADVHAVARDLELARREHFVAFYLDARNRVLSRETVSVGTLSASIVHPREVFAAAIERRAASIVLAHNHPSGDSEPSDDDVALTRRLVQAGILLGIEVLDHLVIGHGTYVSLKSRGLM